MGVRGIFKQILTRAHYTVWSTITYDLVIIYFRRHAYLVYYYALQVL